MIVLALGPPLLAGAWFAGVWLNKNHVTVVIGPLLVAFIVAACFAVNFKRLLREAASEQRTRKDSD